MRVPGATPQLSANYWGDAPGTGHINLKNALDGPIAVGMRSPAIERLERVPLVGHFKWSPETVGKKQAFDLGPTGPQRSERIEIREICLRVRTLGGQEVEVAEFS